MDFILIYSLIVAIIFIAWFVFIVRMYNKIK